MNATQNAIMGAKLGTDASFVKNIFERAPQVGELVALFATPEQVAGMNQKGIKRFVQATEFVLNGNTKAYDAGTAFAVAIVALSTQKRVSFADAHNYMGARVDGAGATAIKGVSRAKLAKHCGAVGTLGTITSKTSRSVGKGGFLTALGVTVKSDAHGFELTESAKSSPFVVAYAQALERMTDGAFALVTAKK